MVAALLAVAALGVFPRPRLMDTPADGMLELGADFSFASAAAGVGSARLGRAAARYDTLVTRGDGAGRARVALSVRTLDEYLGTSTVYDYNVSVAGDVVAISAQSIYGAMYAMETVAQVAHEQGGAVPLGLRIEDTPQHGWRGLLADTGRRFFPMDLLKNLIDTMAAVKMNVLHLHIVDRCRFAVESKVYPALTANLTGLQAGHYTQDDIKTLIAYAGDRGVRVVPELDIPGHANGWAPLASQGMQFCDSRNYQLYGDAAGKTAEILKAVFKEMAALFPDDYLLLGCDETEVEGQCDLNSTFNLEQEMQEYVSNDLKKHPGGWEELLFNAHAAQADSLIYSWSKHYAGDVTSQGFKTIEAHSTEFYFTRPATAAFPQGWVRQWYNVSSTVAAEDQHLLLGGEVSMWSDNFLYINQCESPEAEKPPGWELYNPKYDAEFGRAIGGMVWPRGLVAAQAFWGYYAANVTGEEFTNAVEGINAQVQARGGLTCPNGCQCNETMACDKPYITGESSTTAP
eukprot:TRINITY_DN4091_c0_g4_i1.p1 TRINITY_DN4091_c0_g4~~TRINITY_DN4091_c0_g4_i1.p1  ORF type:complete len:515 (+),score=171.59 TRINITY_DN4091_c0_g4_i1:55-1599(+)